ncbi:hypothetical protein PPERSA_08723 [Pseudocohnilembus persalinus]|uniref:Transmembrane protein n=1 Tax=Pseudocohnilembus persalinus TaxID=266149 RepID=A0A0V0QXT8_PSEPJ|nr:hypothetical protein PPERSA_08723 [Pseudocohnilembus persalinus]|eukprot:KRX07046.1 hypothetical protein PPERSA_08723 [Pseudocohnilembus persalinus]
MTAAVCMDFSKLMVVVYNCTSNNQNNRFLADEESTEDATTYQNTENKGFSFINILYIFFILFTIGVLAYFIYKIIYYQNPDVEYYKKFAVYEKKVLEKKNTFLKEYLSELENEKKKKQLFKPVEKFDIDFEALDNTRIDKYNTNEIYSKFYSGKNQEMDRQSSMNTQNETIIQQGQQVRKQRQQHVLEQGKNSQVSNNTKEEQEEEKDDGQPKFYNTMKNFYKKLLTRSLDPNQGGKKKDNKVNIDINGHHLVFDDKGNIINQDGNPTFDQSTEKVILSYEQQRKNAPIFLKNTAGINNQHNNNNGEGNQGQQGFQKRTISNEQISDISQIDNVSNISNFGIRLSDQGSIKEMQELEDEGDIDWQNEKDKKILNEIQNQSQISNGNKSKNINQQKRMRNVSKQQQQQQNGVIV